MKPILTLLLALFISCACFAQNAKTQKKEATKNNETTLQNNNVSPAEKTQVNTDDELINLREQNRIPGVMDGVYKEEPPKVLPVEIEKTIIKETEKVVTPK